MNTVRIQKLRCFLVEKKVLFESRWEGEKATKNYKASSAVLVNVLTALFCEETDREKWNWYSNKLLEHSNQIAENPRKFRKTSFQPRTRYPFRESRKDVKKKL